MAGSCGFGMATWDWLSVPNMLSILSSCHSYWISRANMLTLQLPDTRGVLLVSVGPVLVFGSLCSGVGVWAEFERDNDLNIK